MTSIQPRTSLSKLWRWFRRAVEIWKFYEIQVLALSENPIEIPKFWILKCEPNACHKNMSMMKIGRIYEELWNSRVSLRDRSRIDTLNAGESQIHLVCQVRKSRGVEKRAATLIVGVQRPGRYRTKLKSLIPLPAFIPWPVNKLHCSGPTCGVFP